MENPHGIRVLEDISCLPPRNWGLTCVSKLGQTEGCSVLETLVSSASLCSNFLWRGVCREVKAPSPLCSKSGGGLVALLRENQEMCCALLPSPKHPWNYGGERARMEPDLWSMLTSDSQRHAWELKSSMNLKSLAVSFTREPALPSAKMARHLAVLTSKPWTRRSQLGSLVSLCSQCASSHDETVFKDVPFGSADKYLCGLPRPNWSLVEWVGVLSLPLDGYRAIHSCFFFLVLVQALLWAQDTPNPAPFFTCISVFSFRSIFYRHLPVFPVPMRSLLPLEITRGHALQYFKY